MAIYKVRIWTEPDSTSIPSTLTLTFKATSLGGKDGDLFLLAPDGKILAAFAKGQWISAIREGAEVGDEPASATPPQPQES